MFSVQGLALEDFELTLDIDMMSEAGRVGSDITDTSAGVLKMGDLMFGDLSRNR